MTNLLKSIFNKFRDYIVETCSDRKKFEPYIICDDKSKISTLFTRARVWTFKNTVNAILMCFKKSLTTEIIDFLLGQQLPLTSPEAYIKRRGCISSKFFKDLNKVLIRESVSSGLLKTWIGNKYLCGIDGTRLSLPYTVELYRLYRGRDDKGHNLARGAFVTDLINRIIVEADIYPNKTEERKAALKLLTSYEFPYPLQSTVFVMDRGYPSLYLMNWFHKNTGGFIMRARRDTSPQIAAFMASDKQTAYALLNLSSNRRNIEYERPQPLTVRLIKRPALSGDDDKEPVVYITNLDACEYSDESIIKAYQLRWHSETEIGTEKNELQIEIFSGIRDICIRQDFYSNIILYNIESLIRIPCNRFLLHNRGKYYIQIDMNCTWEYTIALINAMLRSKWAYTKLLTFIVKLFLKLISVQRPGRSGPRNKRKIKVSGKYITFTNYKRAL